MGSQAPFRASPEVIGSGEQSDYLSALSLPNASEFERHFVQLEVWRNIHPVRDRDEVLLSKAAVAACQDGGVQGFHAEPAVIN